MTSQRGFIYMGVAFALTVITLMFLNVALMSDHWIEIDVDREALQGDSSLAGNLSSNKIYFSSHRGLFRTCYPGKDTVSLQQFVMFVDSECLSEEGYFSESTNSTYEYQVRVHLLRSHLALLIGGDILIIVSLIFGMSSCWYHGRPHLLITAITIFIAAFSIAAAVAMFHGYIYLEESSIMMSSFWAYEKIVHKSLADNRTLTYGYSYIFAWISFVLCLVKFVLYYLAHRYMFAKNTFFHNSRRYKVKEKPPEKEPLPENGCYGANQDLKFVVPANPAYDLSDKVTWNGGHLPSHCSPWKHDHKCPQARTVTKILIDDYDMFGAKYNFDTIAQINHAKNFSEI